MTANRRVALALAALFALTGDAAAQTNIGEITGVVRDSQGGVLPGTTVTAEHVETGTSVQRMTDSEGRYFLPALRIGGYVVTAALPGFQRVVRDRVTVQLGQLITVDFTLAVAGLTEEIHVSVGASLLQAANAEISDIIENREVVQLPLNGRNFLALAQLSDSVVIPPGGTRGDALQQAGPLPNVGGQRSGHNIYMLDGVKVTDELFNNLVISPSVDSIQEFKIQKSQYPAEFGGKASALINVATRAGTNAFRGSLFAFFRDEAFDAHNYFDRRDEPIPPLSQNQFGGALGGPVARDRTFFFLSYEGQRARRSQTRTFSVPTAAVRNGDFSGVADVCDPLTITPATGACTPFAGNSIPANRIDPIAAALLGKVPLPTSSAALQNLTAVATQVKDVDQISARLDHRFPSGDQLFARFSTFDAAEIQPFGTSALQETLVPGFGRTLGTRARNLGVSHTRVFGQTGLNELRAGWMRVTGGQASENRGVDFARSVGLQGVTTDPRDVGYPQISTRGLYSNFGDPTSFVARDNQHFELYDNVTLDRGAHRIKFGAYVFHLQFRPEQPDNARGAFTYTGQFSGNAFADFLLGYPTSAVSGIGRGDENGRTTWAHLFAQDDWRVRGNLTINVGLRYEYNQHMRDEEDGLSSVDYLTPGGRFVLASDDRGAINADPSLLALIPIPYVTSQQLGWDPGLLSPSKVRLAPRTGFALSLLDDRAVVRGGYGIFLNQWAYSVQTAFARNLPFFFTKQVDVPATVRIPSFQTANMLVSDPTGVVAPTIMDYDYHVEYTQTWSGGLQYSLWSSAMAEVSYMGSWTLGADNATVHNVPEPGAGAIQPRRSIPQLGPIRSIRFDGKSIYHGVTIKLEQRPQNGMSYNVSYTLSTSRDDASSPGATEAEANVPQNVRNIFDETGEWANSSFDHRHRIVASGTYQTPSFADAGRVSDVLLSDWRISAIFTAQSGAPLTVNLGVDQANIGAGPAQRPDQLKNPNLAGSEQRPDRWFDTTAFALPAPFTFGSAPRNSVIGPAFANLDLVVAKTWNIAGTRQLELRWEVFNALNTTNFDLPNRIFGTANFGRIFSAKNAREMQFGARVTF